LRPRADFFAIILLLSSLIGDRKAPPDVTVGALNWSRPIAGAFVAIKSNGCLEFQKSANPTRIRGLPYIAVSIARGARQSLHALQSDPDRPFATATALLVAENTGKLALKIAPAR
jgi:hypothetical protein